MIAAGLHMKLRIRRNVVALLLLTGVAVFAMQQTGSSGGSGRAGGKRSASGEDEDVILPNGKSQRDEILKVEHQQNLKDAGDLVDLAQQLRLDLEKNDRYVLSMATLKKTDDIEKLVKRIRTRMRHN
jgi:hypothetical protein